MDTQLQPFDIIQGAEEKFCTIANNNQIDIEFVKESSFAVQLVYKNDKALQAAIQNPTSLQYAMANVASVGLSLNPATSYAYLVPRDGAICLDISYRGLIKIATDTGSIMWAKADVVYSSDTFDYHGPAKVPAHTANPFAEDRGDMVGVYCIAKTCDGDYLVETMKASEVEDVRRKSPSATSSYSAWVNFPGEMWKKCVIKRASKTWPKTERHERLDQAIEFVNQSEGINFDEQSKEDYDLVDSYLHQKNGAAIANLLDGDPEVTRKWAKIIKSFAGKNQIGKHQEMVSGWRKEAEDYVLRVADTIQQTKDPIAITEAYEEMNEHEIKLFWRIISPEQKIDIENTLHSIDHQ